MVFEKLGADEINPAASSKMVLISPMPDLVIPETSASEYILTQLARWGNKETIIDCGNNEKRYTFDNVRESCLRCGSALYRMGVGKGDVVATCLVNSAEYTFILIGANACGGIVTPCNPRYTKVELLQQLKRVEPKVVFTNIENYANLERVCRDLPSVKEIVCIEDSRSKTTFAEFMLRGSSQDYPLDVEVAPDDTALIMFSSGTTGLPKGVMLSNKNLVSLFTMRTNSGKLSRFDVFYMILPIFHIYGFMMTMLVLLHGSRMVIRKRFDFKQMLKDVEKYKITRLAVVPPILVALNQIPNDHGYDLSSLKLITCGAAPLPDGVAQTVSTNFNVPLKQGWGLTEACPAALHLDAFPPQSSVGLTPPNTQIKFIDTETGKELGCEQRGEICIKGPQIMKGYFKDPEATARVIDSEGWLRTGDLGYYDEHEFIYVVDRLKELIKYKGFQVAPAELEEVLLRHSGILDAAVVGIPHEEAGEVPKAFVVKKDPLLLENHVHEFLIDKVAKYKYLRGGVTFVDSIPKSPSGKILRRLLRDMEANRHKTLHARLS